MSDDERSRLRLRRCQAAERLCDTEVAALDALWTEVRQQRALGTVLAMQARLDRLLSALPDTRMSELREQADSVFGASLLQPRPSIVYADPPWAYESGDAHLSAASRHYATMSDEQLAALPVAGLAGEDCALLLWATFPKLRSALRTMAAWGFEYKTVFIVWVKVRRYMARLHGTLGQYTRPNAEVVLLGTRGCMSATACQGFERCNVLLARAHEHSRKPDLVRQIAVELFGDYPRIELFARYPGPPPDWRAWGNQLAPDSAGADEDTVDDDNNNTVDDKQFKRRRRAVAPTFATLESFDAHESLAANDCALPDRLPAPVAGVVTTRRLDQFFAPEAPPVHPTYAPLSTARVAASIDFVRSRQRSNADALFAFNYRKR